MYQGDKYTDASPYEYYLRSKGHAPIHDDTSALLGRWLLLLQEKGEEDALRQIRQELATPEY